MAEPQPILAGPEPRPGDYIKQSAVEAEDGNCQRNAVTAKPRPKQCGPGAALQRTGERGNDADTRAWTVWHERNKAEKGPD